MTYVDITIVFPSQHCYFHSSQLSYNSMILVFLDSMVLNKSQAANSVSADYDKIAGLFEDLDLYLNRLKILEKWVPPVPELEVALTEVLTSVLVLCGICAKYIKMKRLGKETIASSLP